MSRAAGLAIECRDVQLAAKLERCTQPAGSEVIDIISSVQSVEPCAARAPATATVLVVEDDAGVAEVEAATLESSGYRVCHARSAAEARAALERVRPDVILLDLQLPDLDGLVLCATLRALSDAPILVCSARQDTRDRLLSLRLGADDFIAKPFDPYELVARVEALLRRAGRGRAAGAPPAATQVGALRLDHLHQQVTLGGRPIRLTPTEHRLLAALASRPGEVVARDTLARLVWERSDRAAERALDVSVHRLRRKLNVGPGSPVAITAQRGFGYMLAPQE